MTPTRFARRTAACLALGLTFLVGCSGKTPEAAKNDDKKPDDGTTTTNKSSPTLSIAGPTGPADDTTLKAASDFLQSLGDGTVTPATLTPTFLKVIGKPVTFEADIAKGYSADAAVSWVKRVGGGLTLGLPSGTTSGGVASLSGSFQGTQRSGRYLLRLVQEGGWKVDWFQLSTSKSGPSTTPSGTDAAQQQFAASAFLDLLADMSGTTDRLPLVANLLTPELRKAWATPFSQDTKNGYDYSPGQIDGKLAAIGGVDVYTMTVGADGTTKGELTQATGKRAYTLKLTKGTTPGQWLVSEFTTH